MAASADIVALGDEVVAGVADVGWTVTSASGVLCDTAVCFRETAWIGKDAVGCNCAAAATVAASGALGIDGSACTCLGVTCVGTGIHRSGSTMCGGRTSSSAGDDRVGGSAYDLGVGVVLGIVCPCVGMA